MKVVSQSGESAVTRFVLPDSTIGLIRDQLDLCGNAVGMLFPDLDSRAAEMRRYHALSADQANPST